MNSVLKDDFEKKMTVVGLLKQYAEQRDVETFARSLSVTLANDHHQPLLHYIRYLFEILRLLENLTNTERVASVLNHVLFGYKLFVKLS